MKRKSILRRNRFLSLLFGGALGVMFPLYASLFVSFKSPLMLGLFSAGCVIAGFTVGIVSWLINTATLKKTARNLSSALEGVARGDPDALSSVNLDSDDELGVLVENFRNGLSFYQNAARVLGDQRGEVSLLIERVHGSIADVFAAITEFRTAVEGADHSAADLDDRNLEIRRGFETLNKAALMSASHVIELYSAVNEFNTAVTLQSGRMTAVSESLAAIEDLLGLGRASSGETNLRLVSQLISERVARTIESSLGAFALISSNLEAIGGLSERTNVLSINAAIESARLGKEGMGFRIISGNIKLLADEVNALTGKIKSVMAEGDRVLRESTGELSSAAESLEKMIGALKGSVEAMKGNEEDAVGNSERLAAYPAQIGALLQDIKDNTHTLKSDVFSTRNGFDSIMASSTRIHADIASLSEKSQMIERSEKLVSDTLETLLVFLKGFRGKGTEV